MNRPRKLGIAGSAMFTLAAFALVGPSPSLAQCQHGASIFKTCQSPRRQCNDDSQCSDQNECTNDTCDLTESNVPAARSASQTQTSAGTR